MITALLISLFAKQSLNSIDNFLTPTTGCGDRQAHGVFLVRPPVL
jgi:hypothetical protein